jgi:hypothetical protein
VWQLKTGGECLVIPPLRCDGEKIDKHTPEISGPRSNTSALRAKVSAGTRQTRHTFASQWVMGGGSIEKLKEILGHDSVVMTERYAHLRPDLFSKSDLGTIQAPKDLPQTTGARRNGQSRPVSRGLDHVTTTDRLERTSTDNHESSEWKRAAGDRPIWTPAAYTWPSNGHRTSEASLLTLPRGAFQDRREGHPGPRTATRAAWSDRGALPRPTKARRRAPRSGDHHRPRRCLARALRALVACSRADSWRGLST